MLTEVLNLFVENNRIISELDTNFDVSHEELVSHQARYLCVITSGYLETQINRIGNDYKRNGGMSGCKDFLRKMSNPKWCNILSYLANIDPALIQALYYEITNKEQVIHNLQQLALSRNKIAHGESVEISIDEMRDIIGSVNILVSAIEKIVIHHLQEIEV